MNVTGIAWMGVRTPEFDAMRHLLGSVMGMALTHEHDGVAWFDVGGEAEIQIYSDADADHRFFGEGPVIGFMVDDFAGAREELEAAGVELIGPGDENAELCWQHFRGPDGNVYEILGPNPAGAV